MTDAVRILQQVSWTTPLVGMQVESRLFASHGIPHGFMGKGHGGECFHYPRQVHGTSVVVADPNSRHTTDIRPEADGIFTTQPEVTIAVRTADCLPVLAVIGDLAMAIHAGWRGLCAGILGRGMQVARRQAGSPYLDAEQVARRQAGSPYLDAEQVARKQAGSPYLDAEQVARKQAGSPYLDAEQVARKQAGSPYSDAEQVARKQAGSPYSDAEQVSRWVEQSLWTIGPAIGPASYEVGPELVRAVASYDLGLNTEQIALCLTKGKADRWFLDLQTAAVFNLLNLGVPPQNIDVIRLCTYTVHESFHSYRFTQKHSGSNWSFVTLP